MANCWLLRTPVQIVLIIILIVAVPFLIAMIAVYAVYHGGGDSGGTNDSQSESCARLCCSLRNHHRMLLYTVPIRPTTNTPKYKKPKRAIIANETTSPPLIGSLVSNFRATGANLLDYDVECPAAIISNTWALANGDCAYNSAFISVPMDTNYTAKYRVLRKIIKIVKSTRKPTLIAINFHTIEKHYIHSLLKIPSYEGYFPETMNVYYQSWNVSQPILERKLLGKARMQYEFLLGQLKEKRKIYTGAIITDDFNHLLGIVGWNMTRMSVVKSANYLSWLQKIGVFFVI